MTWERSAHDTQEEAAKSRKAKNGRASVKGAEGVREEQIIFARMMALAGDFIVIYAVDPVTDNFEDITLPGISKGWGLPGRGKISLKRPARNAAAQFIRQTKTLLSQCSPKKK